VYDDTDHRFPAPHQQFRPNSSSNDDDVTLVVRSERTLPSRGLGEVDGVE